MQVGPRRVLIENTNHEPRLATRSSYNSKPKGATLFPCRRYRVSTGRRQNKHRPRYSASCLPTFKADQHIRYRESERYRASTRHVVAGEVLHHQSLLVPVDGAFFEELQQLFLALRVVSRVHLQTSQCTRGSIHSMMTWFDACYSSGW